MKLVFFTILLCFYCTSIVLPSSKFIVGQDSINIRVDSTTLSYSLGFLKKGDRLEVLGEKFDWYKIRLPLRFGCYISKKYIRKIGNGKVTITGKNVNLRAKPTTESPIIGKASKSMHFFLLSDDGEWVKIQGHPYTWGWVHKKFLKEIKEIEPIKTPIATTPVSKNIANLSAKQ